MNAWRRRLLSAALILAAASARAADQTSVEAPRLSPTPTARSGPAQALPAASAPSIVPDLAAALAPEGAPAAAGPASAPAAPGRAAAARPVFGRRTTSPAIPALAPAAARSPAPAAASAASTDEPLLVRAREEAAKLGVASFEVPPDRALSALGSMRTDGFSIVPAGELVTADEVAALNAEIDAYEKNRPEFVTSWSLYGNDAPDKWDAHPMRRWQPKEGGASRPVIGKITALLRASMPDEGLELRDANMRIGYRDLDNPHVDEGGYVTVTVTLRGPGTLVYRIEKDGRVEELEAPLGAAAVVTNVERQLATGLPGTVHSSPTSDRYARHPSGVQRRLLILRYKRAGLPPLADAQRKSLRAANERAVRRVLEARARRSK